MPKVVVSLLQGPSVFMRIKGRNGKWREIKALITTGSSYSIISKVDAYILGFHEALIDVQTAMVTGDQRVVPFFGMSGMMYAPIVRIDEVVVGGLTIKDVEFLAYDLPQETCFDAIIGLNVLNKCGAILNFAKGVMEIGEGF